MSCPEDHRPAHGLIGLLVLVLTDCEKEDDQLKVPLISIPSFSSCSTQRESGCILIGMDIYPASISILFFKSCTLLSQTFRNISS